MFLTTLSVLLTVTWMFLIKTELSNKMFDFHVGRIQHLTIRGGFNFKINGDIHAVTTSDVIDYIGWGFVNMGGEKCQKYLFPFVR